MCHYAEGGRGYGSITGIAGKSRRNKKEKRK